MVKQKLIGCFFALFAMELYPVLWCLSPQVLDQLHFAAPKELYKLSLVTMLTLESFGRPHEKISVTP